MTAVQARDILLAAARLDQERFEAAKRVFLKSRAVMLMQVLCRRSCGVLCLLLLACNLARVRVAPSSSCCTLPCVQELAAIFYHMVCQCAGRDTTQQQGSAAPLHARAQLDCSCS